MIMRCFEGRSMPEVMEQVRKEMGEDAIILHIQQRRGLFWWLRRSPKVRIWAAIAKNSKPNISASCVQSPNEQIMSPRKVNNDSDSNFESNLLYFKSANGKVEEISEGKEVEPNVNKDKIADSQGVKKRKRNEEVMVGGERVAITQTRHRELGRAKRTKNDFAEIAIRVERQLQLLASSLWNNKAPFPQVGVFGLLWQCGVDLTTIQQLFSSNPSVPDPIVPTEDWLRSILQRNLPITGGLAPTTSVAVLVGPTGVGKTTTVAKIAANQLMQQRRRVALVTVDVFRVGAVQQLETYARLMGLPFFVATTPEEAQKCICQAKKVAELALVDTIGRSPKQTEQLAALWDLVAAMEPNEVLLTLPANGNPYDLALASDQFSIFCPTSLIITKLDEATQTGVIVNLVTKLNLPVSYITTGQNVPEDLEVPTSERLAEWVLLPLKERNEIGDAEVKGVSGNA